MEITFLWLIFIDYISIFDAYTYINCQGYATPAVTKWKKQLLHRNWRIFVNQVTDWYNSDQMLQRSGLKALLETRSVWWLKVFTLFHAITSFRLGIKVEPFWQDLKYALYGVTNYPFKSVIFNLLAKLWFLWQHF